MEGGVLIGLGHETWKENSVASPEMGGYLLNLSGIMRIQPFTRIQVFPQAGVNMGQNFMSWSGGVKIGWIIHPGHNPFIGGGIHYEFYDRILDKKNQSIFTVEFTGGAQLIRFSSSDFWMFINYRFWNSDYEERVLSAFTLDLAYLLHF
jgi:hypothetical protein